MQWLSDLQIQSVLKSLPQGRGWKACRNRAMVALVLGGGLKPSEVIALDRDIRTAHEPDGCLRLEIPGAGAGRRHQTELMPFVIAPLAEWRRALSVLDCPGTKLFPSSLSGAQMHPTTLYRSVKAVLSAADIPASKIMRRGARTLRNSFAISQLARGCSTDTVGEYLGHRAERSTLHYLDAAPQLRKLGGRRLTR